MKKKRKLIKVLLMLVFLIGCAEKNSEILESNTRKIDTQEDEKASKKQTYIKKEYSNRFHVDAKIEGKQPDEVTLYKMKFREISKESVIDIFLSEYNVADFDEEREEDYWMLNNPETKETLSIISGTLTYEKDIESCELWSEIKNYQYKYGFNANNLNFMTVKEAEEYGNAILEVLNISKEFKVKCDVLSVSTEQLRVYNQEIIETMGKENASLIDFPENSDKYDLYYLIYTLQVDGIDVYNSLKNYTTVNENGMQIEMIVTNDGLKYFSLDNWYDDEKEELEKQNIMSAEDAVEILFNKYDNILGEDINEVKNIKLVYMADLENDKNIILQPYWYIRVQNSEFGEHFIEEYVNAVTGGDYQYGN